MIICNKCGKPIEGNEETCPHCGSKIEARDVYRQWNDEEQEFTVEKESNGKIKLIVGIVIFITLAIFIVIFVSKFFSSHGSEKKSVSNLNDNYTSGSGIENKKDKIDGENKPSEDEKAPEGGKSEKKDNKQDEKQDMVMKYKTVGNKNIIETIYKADMMVRQIITSVNPENIVEKMDNGVEYIQLNSNFNTKNKVKPVLSQYISEKEVDSILSKNVFMEKQGKLYVIYGNVSASMDILKSSVVERKETEQGIEVKINGSDDEGENRTVEGTVTLENNKLVVCNWKFF